MNSRDFRHLYLQIPTPSEREIQLRQLGERYVRETELYDQSVCTGPIGRDGVIPANPRERALSDRNARELFRRLCGEISPPVLPAELRRAISSVDPRSLQA